MSRDVYIHGHHEAVLRSHRWRTAENSAGYLLSRLRPGMTVLDVGCGPGTITVGLARAVAPGRVVAVDVSAEVVAAAEQSAREGGVDNVEWLVGDFREVVQGHFDVAHAHQVVQHVADPVGALRAMGDLGELVAVRDVDIPGMFYWPDSAAIERWRRIYLEVAAHNEAEPAAGRRLPRWAKEAGLLVESYTASAWTYWTTEQRRWWAELWADRTVGGSFAEQAIAYGVASADELQAVAAGWRAWGEEADGAFVVTSGEVLARRGVGGHAGEPGQP